jgi:hypothetical protein
MKTPENTEQNSSLDQVDLAPQPSAVDLPVPGTARKRPTRSNRRVLPRKWTLHTFKEFKPFYYRLESFKKEPYQGVQQWIDRCSDNENLSKEILYTSQNYVIVDKVPNDHARNYIKNNHYLKDITSTEIAYGLYVFNKPEYKDMYLGRKPYPEKFNKWIVYPKLIGVAVYGTPVGATVWSSISKDIKKQSEVKELKRLYVADNIFHAMKNAESFLISHSIKLLKRDHPTIKALISYASPDQLHKGTIYRASNWKWQPLPNQGSSVYQAYSEKTKQFSSGWTHNITLSRQGIASSVDSLKKEFGYPVAIRRLSKKFRYIYILVSGKDLKSFKNNEVHHISDNFPTDAFIQEQIKYYSKMTVWHSENDSIDYETSVDPEKFLIHQGVSKNEK